MKRSRNPDNGSDGNSLWRIDKNLTHIEYNSWVSSITGTHGVRRFWPLLVAEEPERSNVRNICFWNKSSCSSKSRMSKTNSNFASTWFPIFRSKSIWSCFKVPGMNSYFTRKLTCTVFKNRFYSILWFQKFFIRGPYPWTLNVRENLPDVTKSFI